MENRAGVRLLAAVAIASFEIIIRLKILRLPNFIMLFQLVLTKLKSFCVY